MPLELGNTTRSLRMDRTPRVQVGWARWTRAHDSRLRRTVAIKVASSPLNADPQARTRFQHEARAIAALNHPHICAIHDVATFDGHDVIVMEYLDGETLEQRLQRGPISAAELFAIDTPHCRGPRSGAS